MDNVPKRKNSVAKKKRKKKEQRTGPFRVISGVGGGEAKGVQVISDKR